MLWSELGKFSLGADPFESLARLQQEMNRLFEGARVDDLSTRPPLNLWHNDSQALAVFEIPGINPNELEITVAGDTLTVKGERKPSMEDGNVRYHRRERGYGEFARIVELPFPVDASKVQAEYKSGLLRITLPRAEEDKPRKISVAH